MSNGVFHVYTCKDRDGAILYIGMTGDFEGRMNSHRLYSPWYADAISIGTQEYPDRFSAECAERAAIKAHEPPYNKMVLDVREDDTPRQEHLTTKEREQISAAEAERNAAREEYNAVRLKLKKRAEGRQKRWG